jgi:hypothetical protein
MPSPSPELSHVTDWESEGGALPPVPTPGSQLATGHVVKLHPEQGAGYVATEARERPGALRFVRADVKFHRFDALRVGDRVRFLQVGDPENLDRQYAILLEAWPARAGHRAGN